MNVESGYFNLERYTKDLEDQFMEIMYGSDVYLAEGR